MNFLDERWTAIPQGLDRANLYPYEAPRINFIINRGNSLMARGEIEYCSYSKIKDAEDYLSWLALFNRY